MFFALLRLSSSLWRVGNFFLFACYFVEKQATIQLISSEHDWVALEIKVSRHRFLSFSSSFVLKRGKVSASRCNLIKFRLKLVDNRGEGKRWAARKALRMRTLCALATSRARINLPTYFIFPGRTTSRYFSIYSHAYYTEHYKVLLAFSLSPLSWPTFFPKKTRLPPRRW